MHVHVHVHVHVRQQHDVNRGPHLGLRVDQSMECEVGKCNNSSREQRQTRNLQGEQHHTLSLYPVFRLSL